MKPRCKKGDIRFLLGVCAFVPNTWSVVLRPRLIDYVVDKVRLAVLQKHYHPRCTRKCVRKHFAALVMWAEFDENLVLFALLEFMQLIAYLVSYSHWLSIFSLKCSRVKLSILILYRPCVVIKICTLWSRLAKLKNCFEACPNNVGFWALKSTKIRFCSTLQLLKCWFSKWKVVFNSNFLNYS